MVQRLCISGKAFYLYVRMGEDRCFLGFEKPYNTHYFTALQPVEEKHVPTSDSETAIWLSSFGDRNISLPFMR